MQRTQHKNNNPQYFNLIYTSGSNSHNELALESKCAVKIAAYQVGRLSGYLGPRIEEPCSLDRSGFTLRSDKLQGMRSLSIFK